MEKVTAFLEKNVEYFVLGLASLFFLYMVWSYVIVSPLVKEVNKKDETPSTIDAAIERGPLVDLQNAIDNKTVPVFGVKLDTTSADSIINPTVMPARLANYWPSQPMRIHTEQQSPTSGTVTSLPKPPPAQVLLSVTGRSTINSQPAGATPSAGTPATADIFWNETLFTVSADQLRNVWSQAFNAAKMNDPTEFLRVVTYRSEKTATGWSPDTEVPLLPNNGLPPYPDGKDPRASGTYQRNIANRQTPDVTNPPLPTQPSGPAGTVFRTPKDLLATLLNPTTPPRAGTASMLETPGFILVSDNLPFGQARPGGGGRPAAPPPRGPQQGGPAAPPPPFVPGGQNVPTPGVTAPPRRDEIAPESLEPKTFPVTGLKLKILPTASTGMFNPATSTSNAPDWLIYVIDSTAVPGHTYKYRIAYKLLNPLFDKNPLQASDKSWVTQFDLTSEISPYSPEVKTLDKTYFYCAKEGPSGQSLPIEVFTWSGGQWRHHTFSVSPGDKIGDMEKETVKDVKDKDKDSDIQVDYSTGYVFLESTKNRTQKDMASIVDQDGTVSMRDERADANSSDRKKYAAWAEKPSIGNATPGMNIAPGALPPEAAGPAAAPPGGELPPGMIAIPGGGMRAMTEEERRAYEQQQR